MNGYAILSSWSLALGLTLILTGCETIPTHPFSGSAAMRIDVEVYKGPLSQEPEIQWGNLWGLFDQTEHWLIDTDNLTRAIFANKGFSNLRHVSPGQWPLPRIGNNAWTVPADKPLSDHEGIDWKPSETIPFHHASDVDKACYKVQAESPWYSWRFWRLLGLLDTIDHYDCFALVQVIKQMDGVLVRSHSLKLRYHHLRQPLRQLSRTDVRDFLQDLAILSGELKFLALRWSMATGAGHSLDTMVRLAHAHAIVTAAESANQLNARADALLKQLYPNGLDRRELPPGVALRETEPTDFTHIYDWLNADSDVANWLAGIGSSEQRAKAFAQLFADHHWAKTNTVYASGRGKVAMAFIKDDVGNWNLKSFDNAPEELLNAYTDFSKTVVKQAAELAAKAAGNAVLSGAPQVLSSATQLLNLATVNAFGHTTPDSDSKKSNALSPLRQSLLLLLKEKNAQCAKGEDSEQSRLKDCLSDLQNLIKEHSVIVDRIATGMLSSSQIEPQTGRSKKTDSVVPNSPGSGESNGRSNEKTEGPKQSGSVVPKPQSNQDEGGGANEKEADPKGQGRYD